MQNISADLENQNITGPDGQTYAFDIDDFAKKCLIKGLDQIGWTLQFADKITAYEENLKHEKSWMI